MYMVCIQIVRAGGMCVHGVHTDSEGRRYVCVHGVHTDSEGRRYMCVHGVHTDSDGRRYVCVHGVWQEVCVCTWCAYR